MPNLAIKIDVGHQGAINEYVIDWLLKKAIGENA
jgi:hypothetical protein